MAGWSARSQARDEFDPNVSQKWEPVGNRRHAKESDVFLTKSGYLACTTEGVGPGGNDSGLVWWSTRLFTTE